MNILYLETGLYGGGSFESLYQQVKVLDKKKFSPVVVYLNPNRFTERLEALNITYYILQDTLYSSKSNIFLKKICSKIRALTKRVAPRLIINYEFLVHLPLVYSLNRIVNKHNIDLIHLNNQIDRDFFALLVARRNKIPCISHIRSFHSDDFTSPKANYANRNISRYIAYSEGIKKHWVEAGIDAAKTRVIYNAVPPIETIPLNLREELKIKEENIFILGCVGRLVPERGYDFMLKAFAKVLNSYPNCILTIVGETPGEKCQKKELVSLSQQLGIEKAVVFKKFTKKARQIIASLDLLVLPYRIEPFGRVLLEAWQLRTPVIATRVGEIERIVEHEHNGLLVKYGDAEGLGKAIVRLIENQKLRQSIIDNGYKTVREKFNLQKYIEAVQSLYQEVLSQQVAPHLNPLPRGEREG